MNNNLIDNIIVSNAKQCGAVGLKIENNNFKFVFPPMYIDENNFQIDEIKQDIFKLLEVINKYNINQIDENNATEKTELPLYAMLWIVSDFLQNGLYKEIETTKKIQNNGKINWKQTIQKCRPFLDENNNTYYNKFVTNEVKLKQDDYFVEIQEYCIKKSINLIGWYFNLQYEEQQEKTIAQLQEYIVFLKSILQNTFFDYKKQLIVNMISILENQCEENSAFDKDEIFTDKFEIVFENLVVDVFSIERDLLKFFYPYSKWIPLEGIEKKRPNLRPDAIYINDKNIYILDAKNYSFGYDANIGSLPETTSVEKQVTYAQYLLKNYKEIKQEVNKEKSGVFSQEFGKVFNFFIMPSYKNNLGDDNMKYIGHFEPKWCENNENSFEKIHTILIDLKTLVDAHFDKALKQTLRKEFLELCNNNDIK